MEGHVLAGYLGNSVICCPHADLLVAVRPEPTLLVADCVPSEYGETHPLGTRYLEDLQRDLYR